MNDLSEMQLVVAVTGEDGLGHFRETPPPPRFGAPETGEVAFAWSTEATPDLQQAIGGLPADNSFPLPGASKFALVSVPPRASGAWDAAHSAKAMHASATIDYEVVISGKIDIILDSGERRTLTPGSCLVMAGANHAWSNPYDEPCIYAAIILGANSTTVMPPVFSTDPA
jgi:quercetin dioxygenase-like cupin family protein